MMEILRSRSDVRRVVLFGSLAEGRVRRASDVDLVVVVDTDRRFLDRLDDLYRALCPRVALDLLALTPAEFQRLATESPWLRRALARGRVLHAA
ncbi:MAG: nucleotidyltransferase domain-containing protein [Myxococcota bacterium]|nr:nucleotidyltransferase domain-containing protein [Myxococcota bacterium]